MLFKCSLLDIRSISSEYKDHILPSNNVIFTFYSSTKWLRVTWALTGSQRCNFCNVTISLYKSSDTYPCLKALTSFLLSEYNRSKTNFEKTRPWAHWLYPSFLAGWFGFDRGTFCLWGVCPPNCTGCSKKKFFLKANGTYSNKKKSKKGERL